MEKTFVKLTLTDELKQLLVKYAQDSERIDPDAELELKPEEIVIEVRDAHCGDCAAGRDCGTRMDA